MPNDSPNANGWDEYKRLVMNELEDLGSKFDKMQEDITTMREEVASLKVKSGIWGAIAGLIPTVILLVYFLAK